MKFLFIASGRVTPATRYRVEPFVPLLETAGHHCDVAYSFPEKYDYFPSIGWRLSQRLKRNVRHWHAFLAARRNYDAIFIEREVFDDDTSDLEEKFRRRTPRLILDVDDAVFLRHRDKFDRVAEISDVAIAGNRWLAEYLAPRCPQVVQIPTCVRMVEYTQRPESSGESTPVVGWIGTPHNVPFLTIAAPALRQVARELPFRLLIVATDERLHEVDLDGVNVDFRTWSPKRDIADLHEMDIGLMPLPDDDLWMKYKCGLKLIQYLAVGAPGIATPIGVNAEILAGNRVGRAVRNDAEWASALIELLSDQSLRSVLGQAGRQLVREQFSVEANWKKLEAVLLGS